ncbi:hypothetical protein AGMMS49532_03780 [Endomicrobiia bacterium]|nr:hypothetical protein AGMMS49532_03780 [Endomicrobiia bacterium]
MDHPCVLECVECRGYKERGAVIKILAKGYKAFPELITELQNHVKKVTAPYKYPIIIEFVKEISKTISGNIKRIEIRESDEK